MTPRRGWTQPHLRPHLRRLPQLPVNLNYPSFVALFDTAIEGRHGRVSAGQAAQSQTIRLTRTVTNVGSTASSYKVTVSAPETVKAVVVSDVLSFTAKGETKSYTVSVLIATLTYQAALNPPGGFWQDYKTRMTKPDRQAPAPLEHLLTRALQSIVTLMASRIMWLLI
ncbi:hypothetical protein EJ110_NYTH54074 [Nymphaea thermarum]|nr:hypothetical protein EJ110_NYTH54074 [Nymphaea thermarum]